MEVRWKSDGRPTEVGRTKVSCYCCDGSIAVRNVAMALFLQHSDGVVALVELAAALLQLATALL
jgi:hypothetical protein